MLTPLCHTEGIVRLSYFRCTLLVLKQMTLPFAHTRVTARHMVGHHFLILHMDGMWVSSGVSLYVRASDALVYLFVDYFETPQESAPPTVQHKDLDVILEDFKSFGTREVS